MWSDITEMASVANSRVPSLHKNASRNCQSWHLQSSGSEPKTRSQRGEPSGERCCRSALRQGCGISAARVPSPTLQIRWPGKQHPYSSPGLPAPEGRTWASFSKNYGCVFWAVWRLPQLPAWGLTVNASGSEHSQGEGGTCQKHLKANVLATEAWVKDDSQDEQ